jgi:predicted amidohydrolase/GNAT superfamily N-acetyltransferase
MSRRPRAKVRRAETADIDAIYACQNAAYQGLPPGSLCTRRHFDLQLAAFPDGQLVAEVDGRLVGYATALIVTLGEDSPWHSYNEITGSSTFRTHTPSGDTLYGADIAVHPDYRGRGVARKLYDGRKRLVRRLNLRCMVAGGRIPGFRAYQGRLTAEEYVDEVVAGRLADPALSVHLRVGYRVRAVYHGYVRDEQSLDYATLLEWQNDRFKPTRRRLAAAPLGRAVRRVRVCAAQYEMKPIQDFEQLADRVRFFVATAESYHCHFLVLPELFTAQLFSAFDPTLGSVAAMRELATRVSEYRELLRGLAIDAGLFIVGGSTPVDREGRLYNVAHLFTPQGRVLTQDKLHITPNERSAYGIAPGVGLTVFDTGLARCAMLVCYDIEFPELARLLTLSGAEILFVPFSTDERKAYLRVRYCAQARAVENAVYCVLSGNVGNLPSVENFLINYGHAAVCTPSDFLFPTEGIAAVADTNTEAVVIADLDLDALHTAREVGSVRPLRDRRLDVYGLEAHQAVQVVRTTLDAEG